MEFGLISKLEQFEFDSQRQTQIVNASKESKGVEEQPDIKEIIKQEQKEAVEETKKTVNEPSKFSNYNEFTLTNLNFGFNSDSQDFFVKAIRGDIENQYPTDEMMRLKAHFIEENRAS